jgi:predicted dehydrogenase
LVQWEDLGKVMFIRDRYGHGGRVGYDREWRMDPAQAGGGELIDQGVHLIDLALHRMPVPGPKEGRKTLEIVEPIYRKSGYEF